MRFVILPCLSATFEREFSEVEGDKIKLDRAPIYWFSSVMSFVILPMAMV